MEPLERILIIDDDMDLCALVGRFLTGEGFQAEFAHSGAGGARKALAGEFSIILLDVMMPDLSGFEVLRRVRAQSRIPVLMLTARGDTQDRVQGLELGADDYLPKPFDPPELAARIRAILRRANAAATAHVRFRLADVEMDLGSRSVRRDGSPLELTTVEFDLLAALMRSAGSAVSRERLTRDVLGRDFSPFDRSIDTHVYNLRRKLGALADGQERIKSIRGSGYLYAAPGV